jgi:hypothetical protein
MRFLSISHPQSLILTILFIVIELIRTEFSFTSHRGFDIISRRWEMFSQNSAENVYRISSEWRIWMLNPIKKIHRETMVGEAEKSA